MLSKKLLTGITIILAAAGILSAAAIVFVAQQLNSRVYEYAGSLGARQEHFEDAMSRICTPLLVIGLATGAGSVAILVLSIVGISTGPGKEELLSLLDSCGVGRDVNDPLQSLQGAIGTMRLDLAEARKRERSIIERAVDVICIVDIHSKFISVSKACQNAWGYTPQELENKSLTDLIVSENTNNILNSILGSAKSIDKIVFECKLKRSDGRMLDVIWTAHWSASDGGLFCIVHDITERKYAEVLLKNSERRLRRTLKNLPVGVLIIDAGGTVEFANTEALRMMNCKIDQLRSARLESIFTETEAIAGLQADPAAAEEQVKRSKGKAKRFDGSTFPVELSETIIDYGNEEKNIAVFLDKTAEHELEQVKREFMAMVTHEVRTPISSVYGILALLESGALGQLSEKGMELTRGVKATCKRVLRLVSDLLDLEKIQAGKFALDRKKVSIQYALENSFDNVQPLTQERNISIVLPQTDLCCFADEDRLVQVLVNLLGNAIKYSPDNSRIVISIIEGETHVILTVSDQGRGIPEDKLAKIFGHYEQVDLADSKKMGGSGLGLAICKAIVLEHGGDIGVKSKLGEGSSFWFSMPKLTAEQESAANVAAMMHRSASEELERPV